MDRSLGKRIRECTMKHYNYMVTVGEEEVKNKTLSVRSRGSKDIQHISVPSFRENLLAELDLYACLFKVTLEGNAASPRECTSKYPKSF